MNSPPQLLRSLITYAICVPLALVLGYLLSSPMGWGTLGTMIVLLFVLLLPILLKFNHAMLVVGWNASMIIFFLPGAPKVWLPLVALSLGISIVRRTIDPSFRFISVPRLAWPLLVLAAVVMVTAQATGGIKLRSMGGEIYGGKRYIFLLGAIAGYFALTAHPVPRNRARLYMALFLLGGLTTLIGDVLYVENRALQVVFWLFPPNLYTLGGLGFEGGQMARFAGIKGAATVLFAYMLARYGIREIFTFRYPWRFAFFAFFGFASLLGGFRSSLLSLILLFCIQFYLEGLHRTKLLPILLFGFTLVAVVSVPFVRQMPFSIQRTLSVLPIDVDPVARADAEGSSEWRLQIWKAVLPQVPEYLLLGKGLALTHKDFESSVGSITGTLRETSADQGWAALAGDYHNGPLSVIIPFGIWGVIGFVWLLVAGFRVLHRNLKHGDPELRIMNAFLFSAFTAKTLLFLVVVGGLYSNIHEFIGYLAMSVCLNGGVAKPVPEVRPESVRAKAPSSLMRPRLAPGRAG